MKIYIFADMEGISGISRMEQVMPDNAAYPGACEWMMQDINNAIDAAFEAGATEVVACDTHGGGGQVQVAKMDPRATYETPNGSLSMPSLDETFDGVILLGHHAKAGTLNGFLDHTESSASWFEYRINDQVVGEVGITAAYVGHFGVPIIVVTGDEAVANEAKALLGDVECAIVKWGIGRNRAKCLSLPKAHAVIRETIHRAIKTCKSRKPWQPKLPVVEQLTLYRSDMADNLAIYSGVERVDARTLRRTVNSLKDICIW
jgi:D-amino peptidase